MQPHHGKFDWIWTKFEQNKGKIWAKSKSCIPKNIRSPTAMIQPSLQLLS